MDGRSPVHAIVTALWRALHVTMGKVLQDTEAMRFNTAIAQMMTFVNEATASATLPREIASSLLRIISPYAPHLAEELWAQLGEQGLVAHTTWPTHDPRLCVDDVVTLIVQVDGKLRDRIDVPREADEKTLETIARRAPNAVKVLAGREPKKVIVVPGRLVNIVVS